MLTENLCVQPDAYDIIIALLARVAHRVQLRNRATTDVERRALHMQSRVAVEEWQYLVECEAYCHNGDVIGRQQWLAITGPAQVRQKTGYDATRAARYLLDDDTIHRD